MLVLVVCMIGFDIEAVLLTDGLAICKQKEIVRICVF